MHTNTELFETEKSESGCVLKAYRGHQTKVVIPSFITEIGDTAFRRNLELTEIEIPSSVEKIGSEAFNGCLGLRRVVFHEGLLFIMSRSFWNCSGLISVVFPESLELIGARAFECCSMLADVEIRNPDTFVDENAFRETPWYEEQTRRTGNLREAGSIQEERNSLDLMIPEGVINIDMWEYSRSGIRTLSLPDSLRTVGMCAFKDCVKLEKVTMSPNTYCNYNETLKPREDEGIFSGCVSLTDVIFRGALKNFVWSDAGTPELLHGFDPERTFLKCSSLKRITACEIPLAFFPPEWLQFALNGYLSDPERETDYLPEIAEEYDRKLFKMIPQLIRRAKTDPTVALCGYLMNHELLSPKDTDDLIASSSGKNPEAAAALLRYKKEHFQKGNFLEMLSL